MLHCVVFVCYVSLSVNQLIKIYCHNCNHASYDFIHLLMQNSLSYFNFIVFMLYCVRKSAH